MDMYPMHPMHMHSMHMHPMHMHPMHNFQVTIHRSDGSRAASSVRTSPTTPVASETPATEGEAEGSAPRPKFRTSIERTADGRFKVQIHRP